MQIEESEILFWDDVCGREETQVSPHVQNQSVCMKTAVRQNGMKRAKKHTVHLHEKIFE